MAVADLVHEMLDSARRQYRDNVRGLTLEEALSSAGGYRSIVGVIKHIGGWTRVYWSYAFEDEPLHWEQTSWPGGLRDTIEASEEYLHEVIAWVDGSIAAWDASLAGLEGQAFDELYALHWGDRAPLARIVVMVTQHINYHVGELNMLLSIARREAWEYGEEVEENHISTYGHGVRSDWMSDDYVRECEEKLRAHLRQVSAAPGPA